MEQDIKERQSAWSSGAIMDDTTSGSTAARQGFPFLDLPPEVRNMIYNKILVVPNAIEVHIRKNTRYPDTMQNPNTSILRACRANYREASSILYGCNTFAGDFQDMYDFAHNIGDSIKHIRNLKLYSQEIKRRSCYRDPDHIQGPVERPYPEHLWKAIPVLGRARFLRGVVCFVNACNPRSIRNTARMLAPYVQAMMKNGVCGKRGSLRGVDLKVFCDKSCFSRALPEKCRDVVGMKEELEELLLRRVKVRMRQEARHWKGWK